MKPDCLNRLITCKYCLPVRRSNINLWTILCRQRYPFSDPQESRDTVSMLLDQMGTMFRLGHRVRAAEVQALHGHHDQARTSATCTDGSQLVRFSHPTRNTIPPRAVDVVADSDIKLRPRWKVCHHMPDGQLRALLAGPSPLIPMPASFSARNRIGKLFLFRTT